VRGLQRDLAMTRLFPRLERPDDGIVLRVADRTLSSRRLAEACAGHRFRLHAAGVGSGAHVAVWTQPTLETAVALIANAATGFVSIPLDPKLGSFELAHIVSESKPVVALATVPASVEARLPQVPTLRVTLDGLSMPLDGRQVDDAPLLILSTSGTTGLPKGAVLSARNVAFDLDALAQVWEWTAADTVVHALPLFHVHGLVLGLFGSIRVGGALHWFPKFEAREVAAALSERRTMLFAVPTMYHRLSLAEASVLEGLKAARVLISGSAGLPLRDHQRIEALTGKRVFERYGLTETVINTAVSLTAATGAGTVGHALPGIELKLVDDSRVTLEVRDDATIGEIAVRGPNVFLEYLNRPEATAAVKDADGWFYTGDLGCMRADGAVRIVGRRATDVIKCAGFKVGAGEVEAALLEHPVVREAAVLGAPDADLGEKIVAFVVVSAEVDPGELSNFVAAQLSPHKRPREVRLVTELPRNAMGKVQKSLLRDLL
jgi:malonyl-CoA/methylmalonyl-CoA synthetase